MLGFLSLTICTIVFAWWIFKESIGMLIGMFIFLGTSYFLFYSLYTAFTIRHTNKIRLLPLNLCVITYHVFFMFNIENLHGLLGQATSAYYGLTVFSLLMSEMLIYFVHKDQRKDEDPQDNESEKRLFQLSIPFVTVRLHHNNEIRDYMYKKYMDIKVGDIVYVPVDSYEEPATVINVFQRDVWNTKAHLSRYKYIIGKAL